MRQRPLASPGTFNGYSKAKEVTIVLWPLVNLDAAHVRQVGQVWRTREFVTTWDRLLDKETF